MEKKMVMAKESVSNGKSEESIRTRMRGRRRG